MYIFLWSFFILGFVGWLGEVAYAAIIEKKFVNRGFLNGPICPIYGMGAIAMYVALKPIHNFMLLFLGSMFVGSLVEWIAGFLLEKIFHQKWWDYSDFPYNLNGYVCLSFSTIWGVAGVLVVQIIMPFLTNVITLIPKEPGAILLFVFSAVILADLILTMISISGLQQKLKNLEMLSDRIRSSSDFIGKAVSGTVLTAKEKYDELLIKEKYDELSDKAKLDLQEFKEKYQALMSNLQENRIEARLIKAFPRAQSHLYDEQLKQIQDAFHIISKKSNDFFKKRNEFAASAYHTNDNGKSKPFAGGIGFAKLFWVFMIGSLIGFVAETIWCLVSPPHQFQLRVSVLYGPFVLVYGLGGVVLTLLLHRFHNKKDIYLFGLSMVIGGAFEYFCSYLQEMLFGSVSWDYTNSFMNIGGRTNLTYAVFWGLLGMIWIKDVYPRISLLIEKTPHRIGGVVTAITAIFMCTNIMLSASAVYRQYQRRQNIPAKSAFEIFLDHTFDDQFLATRYTNMKFLD